MCRILITVGFSWKRFLGDFIEVSRRDRTMGWSHGDGWGMAYVVDGGAGVYRSVNPIWESFMAPPDNATALLVHSRYASVGAKRIENTHPFTRGKYALAHNGTIVREKLVERMKEMGLSTCTAGDTDSELLVEFIARYGPAEGLAKIYEAAHDILDPEEPMLNVAVLDLEQGAGWVLNYFEHFNEHFAMRYTVADDSVTVASEPLGEVTWEYVADAGKPTVVSITRSGIEVRRL